MLFNKGDPKSVENYYWPITILPILYKLFSKVLLAKVKDILCAQQSVSQAGFRKGYACDDHLFVVTMLSEMFTEFQSPLWLVAVDFKKAFDCISHDCLWNSLREQGVPPLLVFTLQRF